MKFSTALFALSSAVGAFAINSFTTPIGNETLTAGETFIIRWNNTNGGDTVDLLLKKGNASNLETALTISTGLKNVGAVRWFLPEELYTGSDYALQITNKDDTNDINYSPFFTIIGKDPVTTTSSSSSSTTTTKRSSTSTSAAATSTEASTTEASSTEEATTSAAPNTTVASSTLAATSSFVNSTVVVSSTKSSAASTHASSSAKASGSATGSAAASSTTTAAGVNGASALSLNNAVIAVGLAGAAFFGL